MADKIGFKKDWNGARLDDLGIELIDWLEANPNDNYLLLEFFNDRKIPMEWVESWVSKSDKYSNLFKRSYKIAEQIQLQRLIKRVVSKDYATAGLIAVLKNLCGWTSANPDEKPAELNITPDTVEKIKEKYFKKKEKLVGVSEDGELFAESVFP